MFRIQKISNYGTSTPAVARTFSQGCEVLEWFDVAENQIGEARQVLLDLQRHLLRCVEQRDALEAEMQAALGDAEQLKDLQAPINRDKVIPGVGDLQGRAEAFLHAAKLAVAATGNLIRPFYATGFNHNFQRFGDWAANEFGENDPFTVVIKSWEPFTRRISDMRNAVDHPKDVPGGRLLTENYRLNPEKGNEIEILLPSWGLLGEDLMPMLESFDHAIELIIQLGENVLARLFYKLKKPFPVTLKDIPEAERNPENPKRLEVTLAQ